MRKDSKVHLIGVHLSAKMGYRDDSIKRGALLIPSITNKLKYFIELFTSPEFMEKEALKKSIELEEKRM